MAAFIESGRGVVVMTNGDQGSRLAMEIFRSVAREYGWPAFQSRQKTVARIDPALLAPLAGRYELRPGKTIEVVLEAGKLIAVDGEERIELYPESATRFFELVEEHDIEFLKGADGKATHLVIDRELKALRIAG